MRIAPTPRKEKDQTVHRRGVKSMTAYPTLEIRIDVATRAILAQEGVVLRDAIERYTQTYSGYECNDDGMVRLDEFAVPNLKRTTSDTYMAVDAYLRCEETTVYGATQKVDGSFHPPLVMVHHVNLGETVAAAAVGRRLREMITINHPVLERLAECTVLRVKNGDARPNGGDAYCHILLDPAWGTENVTLGRRTG